MLGSQHTHQYYRELQHMVESHSGNTRFFSNRVSTLSINQNGKNKFNTEVQKLRQLEERDICRTVDHDTDT